MRGRYFYKSILIFSVLVLFVPAASFAAGFSRNLAEGASGPDVTLLQKILNLSPETQVALSGPGSPGNETSFFGAATKAAVVKFQNLYASDVLAPAGLSSGTGYVGTFTLKKLTALVPLLTPSVPAIQNPVSNPAPISHAAPAAQNQTVPTNTAPANLTPVITSLSISPSTPLTIGEPAKAASGAYVFDNTDTVIITGKNFTKSNTIDFSNDEPLSGILSAGGTSVSFTFNSTAAAAIEKGLSTLSSSTKQTVLSKIIAGSATKSTDPALTNGIYMPMTISVQNENGISNAIPIVLNIAKGL